MRRPEQSSIVPPGNDQDVYLVLDDFREERFRSAMLSNQTMLLWDWSQHLCGQA